MKQLLVVIMHTHTYMDDQAESPWVIC